MPVVTGNVEIFHRAQMGQDVYIYGIRTYQTYIYIYIYTYIYTYRQFSVFTTSVGLAALAPIISPIVKQLQTSGQNNGVP